MKTRNGFTLVELLVVAVIGTLLVLGVLQVLITNRQTFTVQNAELQNQQQLRASIEVLLTELRQVSAIGGDILEANPSSVRIRSMDDFGVVCEVGTGSFEVVPYADPFAVEDVFVFTEKDPLTSVDDSWELWTPDDVTDESCVTPAGTVDSQRFDFTGTPATWIDEDSVLVGAPVRNFETHTWSAFDAGDGFWYLGLARGNADPVRVVGPLQPTSRPEAIQFRYLNAAGNELLSTAPLTDVRQIEVKAYTWSPATTRDGANVQDSLVLRVYTRN